MATSSTIIKKNKTIRKVAQGILKQIALYPDEGQIVLNKLSTILEKNYNNKLPENKEQYDKLYEILETEFSSNSSSSSSSSSSTSSSDETTTTQSETSLPTTTNTTQQQQQQQSDEIMSDLELFEQITKINGSGMNRGMKVYFTKNILRKAKRFTDEEIAELLGETESQPQPPSSITTAPPPSRSSKRTVREPPTSSSSPSLNNVSSSLPVEDDVEEEELKKQKVLGDDQDQDQDQTNLQKPETVESLLAELGVGVN